MTYYSGDAITISGAFQDSAGAATDPTDLQLVVRAYDGTATTYEYDPGDIEKDSTGNFHLDWQAPSVDRDRIYEAQWIPTGAVQRSSHPERIYVSPVLD